MGDVLNRGTKDRPSWYCRYIDVDGKRKQRATRQMSRALALRFLAEVEARIARGKIGIPEPSEEDRAKETITVRVLSERFLDEYSTPRIKDMKTYRSQARSTFKCRIWPTLGDRAAASVGTRDVERLRDAQLAAGLRPGSVAQTLAALSKLYAWGNKVELIACGNPVAGCERTSSAREVDFLSRGEVGRALAYAEEQAEALHPMIATAIYSGLRKGELFGLRWPDVHLDAGRIDVMRSYLLLPKSGKVRHIGMHPALTRILQRWRSACPPTAEGLVFPVVEGNRPPRMGSKVDMLGLAELLTAAGCHVPKKPWHSLRHTFASHFMMSGGNILTLQKLLGHSDLKMTLVYAHLAPDFMTSEITRLNFPTPSHANVIAIDHR